MREREREREREHAHTHTHTHTHTYTHTRRGHVETLETMKEALGVRKRVLVVYRERQTGRET